MGVVWFPTPSKKGKNMDTFLNYFMPTVLSAYYIFILSDIPRKNFIDKLILFLACLIPLVNITLSISFFTFETIQLIRIFLNHDNPKSVGQ